MRDLHRFIHMDLMPRQHKMTFQAFDALALLAHGRDTIIEIGVFAGAVTRLFSVFAKTIHSVDHFKGDWAAGEYDPDGLFAEFAATNPEAIEEGQVIPHRMSSDEAAEAFRAQGITADLIWIDGDHSYEQCKRDIENYLPMLRPGGVLCGHDAGPFEGVNRAVDELLPEAFWLPSWMWTWTGQGRVIEDRHVITFEPFDVPGLKLNYADGTDGGIALAGMNEN